MNICFWRLIFILAVPQPGRDASEQTLASLVSPLGPSSLDQEQHLSSEQFDWVSIASNICVEESDRILGNLGRPIPTAESCTVLRWELRGHGLF